jgi:hypothetical protein
MSFRSVTTEEYEQDEAAANTENSVDDFLLVDDSSPSRRSDSFMIHPLSSSLSPLSQGFPYLRNSVANARQQSVIVTPSIPSRFVLQMRPFSSSLSLLEDDDLYEAAGEEFNENICNQTWINDHDYSQSPPAALTTDTTEIYHYNNSYHRRQYHHTFTTEFIAMEENDGIGHENEDLISFHTPPPSPNQKGTVTEPQLVLCPQQILLSEQQRLDQNENHHDLMIVNHAGSTTSTKVRSHQQVHSNCQHLFLPNDI